MDEGFSLEGCDEGAFLGIYGDESEENLGYFGSGTLLHLSEDLQEMGQVVSIMQVKGCCVLLGAWQKALHQAIHDMVTLPIEEWHFAINNKADSFPQIDNILVGDE